MWFTDPAFPIFLIVVVCAFWALPERYRIGWLLVSSYFFYGYNIPEQCLLMFGVSIVSYWAGISIETSLAENNRFKARLSLAAMLFVSVAALAYFKYANFILHNLAYFSDRFNLHLDILLPAGISFYTFQALAYAADVYMGKVAAERHAPRFLVFKSFFPQLVAGPIERADNLLRQLSEPRCFSSPFFWSGIDLIVRGFVKKLVVADNIAVYVNMIFAHNKPSSLLVIVGTIGFGVQILADFSGYTDIARGVGRLLGFDLLENFKNPYLATSPSDFWRRWHISLSNCIRDYLYIPLGGSRVSVPRWVLNLFIVWFICGLWHGAAWNYIAWGVFWAVALIAQRMTPNIGSSTASTLVRWLVTFVIINIGWLIFRVDDLALISQYFSASSWKLVFGHSGPARAMNAATLSIGLIVLFFCIPLFVMLLGQLWFARCSPKLLAKTNVERRIVMYSLALCLLWVFRSEGNVEFIYFQF